MSAKRAAVYARVSTAEQVDGTSLTTQVETCGAYAAVQGWSAAGNYVAEGVSGAKASRPALDRLLGAVRAGAVDVVVVSKLDRIGRSMRHLAALLGELDDRDVALVSVSEAFDSSTPSGRLHRNMLGSFAEFEREQIRERMSSGRDAAIRAGRWVSTNAPYGYRITGSGNDRRIIIDPDEAHTLTVAIELYVNERYSSGQVATELNARGLRPRIAARWTGNDLRLLLSNADAISGTWTWRHPKHGYKAAPITLTVPAIIDVTTHERLRARMADSSRRQTHTSDRYLLAGHLRSPHGRAMYGLTNSSRMYRCSEVFATNAPTGGRTCDCRTVRAQPAEDAVWAEVCALLADPGRLLAMSGIQLAHDTSGVAASADDLGAIDRRITRLELAAGQRLSRLLADGLDPAVAGHAAQGLSEELAAARRHRAQVSAWQAVNAERHSRSERLMELARRAEQILPDADAATKRRVLALLQVEVTVQGWAPCGTCNGVGYLATFGPGQAPKRPPGAKRQVHAVSCPACHRHRQVPRLLIEGLVPEADLDAAVADPASERWPFRVRDTAG